MARQGVNVEAGVEAVRWHESRPSSRHLEEHPGPFLVLLQFDSL
jgi:hypothetical protein